ncbi:unnamed protein product, partial [Parnassius apollo]
IVPVLLIAAIARYKCEPISGYNNYGNSASQFGDLLKPPPLPLPIAPVPFHGGKAQRQNTNFGYHYQPAPLITPIQRPSDFKLPAPFYKQYNFNFVPAPQPFSTTPSPSLFQKISGWLFPSQQVNTKVNNYNSESSNKDCNPCNLVPWIPVIKYNLGETNSQPSLSSNYGPPSSTALAQNLVQFRPQPFDTTNQDQRLNQLLLEKPNIPYEISDQTQLSSNIFTNPSSTYGPPSATQQISISSLSPSSSTYSIQKSSYGLSSTSTRPHNSVNGLSFPSYDSPTSTQIPSSYVTPLSSVTVSHEVKTLVPISQTYIPVENDLEVLNTAIPSENIQLPKVSHPIGFKNSYGEDITNSHSLDIPYSLTAIGADSTKIKTHNKFNSLEPNVSVALANPAPFSLNRGRNIHTLQPVALPNLSVSPLPPIFNARPFRPIAFPNYPFRLAHDINYVKKTSNNINVAKSVPVAEFVHSIEYPTTIIESPVIDIDATKSTSNHNKSFRNIPNSYVIDEVRDISPQASEDHVSAATANHDVSFETTGAEFGNNFSENKLPLDMKQYSHVPANHKPDFADLRGAKDEDVDRYRTESNLQSIDSPLLYLKPSAPHKNYENFVLTISTPASQKEYEMYDDITTTVAPKQSNISDDLDESRKYYRKDLPTSTSEHENHPKILQIIVPYIMEQKQGKNNKELGSISQEVQHSLTKEEYQGRKVPVNTEISKYSNDIETSTVLSTTTEQQSTSTVTEYYETELPNTPTVLSDFYNVNDPTFDIIKLQHTIDDWTEQEYSNHYATPDRTRSNEKHAKQIPDEFLTTINPYSHQNTATNDYNYDDFDHEGSSSIQYSVADITNGTFLKSQKEYNTIDRIKNKSETGKDLDDNQKLRIYTAASSFRGTTTTLAPWGSIQTSISPLTNEKVYVVTSKPWRDKTAKTNEFDDKFESKKASSDGDDSITDSFPFKSPRFVSRPPFGFKVSGPALLDSIKSDSSYGFSKGWHQSINNLRSLDQGILSLERPDERVHVKTDEDTAKSEDFDDK